jgi:hypothetical protein
VEAIPFAIPYVNPLRFASGEVHTAEHVLVRVHTDDGVTGVAEAPPRPFTYGETQASIIAVIQQLFAPQVVGRTLPEREAIGARVARTVGNPTAKAAIDMAIWDALGRTLGLPVSDLLGGYTDRMRVSHMLGFDDPAKMVAEAERMRDTYGIRTLKVKVGRRPVSLDTAVVRALRERFGDSVELYVDGNRGWTASESLRAMKEMADLDLLFAEELCPADDVLGRQWLVKQLDVAHRRRIGPDALRRDPRGARRFRHRRQHQDRPHRLHPVTAGTPPRRGPRPGGRYGQPNRRPARHRLHHRPRRRLPAHLAARRRTVQLPGHERRPAGRAVADPRRRAFVCHPGRASASRSTPTSSPATAPTAEPRLAGLEERFTLAVQSCSSQNLSSSPCSS